MQGLGRRSGAKLFDVRADPFEKRNLLAPGSAPFDLEEFESLTEAYRAMPEPFWLKDVQRIELDDLQKGQLRAIGYSID